MKSSLWLLLLAQSTGSAVAFVTDVHRQNAASSSSSSSALRDAEIPEPLAEEGNWQAFLDEETTGLVYYFDAESGQSLWEPPTPTFPQVRLPRKKQREMEDLRRRYRQSRQRQDQASMQQEPMAEEPDVEEEPKQEIPSWIDGLVDRKEPQKKQQVEEVKSETKKGGNWLGGIFGAGGNDDGEKGGPELADGETLVKQKDSLKPSIGGIFGSFGGGKATATEQVKESATATVEKAAPAKIQKEEKIEVIKPTVIKIEMGSHVIPHPAKIRWGGEDAVFTKGRTFGVFDGVSGADKLDGVPLYSRTLAQEMRKAVGEDGISVQEMTKLLTDAANYADGSATGASTAVVASIGENGFLQALNVGDSYCLVVRGGRIAAKTREISHYWECPYQLSDDSPDRPRDGTKLNVELIPGDLIIMGSDGVFDNVDDDMLLDTVSKASNAKPAQLAKKICDVSRKQSTDRTATTPYAKQAQRRGDPDYKDGVGGKVDDISCVVVRCK